VSRSSLWRGVPAAAAAASVGSMVWSSSSMCCPLAFATAAAREASGLLAKSVPTGVLLLPAYLCGKHTHDRGFLHVKIDLVWPQQALYIALQIARPLSTGDSLGETTLPKGGLRMRTCRLLAFSHGDDHTEHAWSAH
jgi:hypothetical protein